MTEHAARWSEPGYGDVTSARLVDGGLEVAFANGDLVRLPLAAVGVDARADAQARVEDGLRVAISVQGREVGVSWTAIRSATDAEYARHLAELVSEEAARVGRRLKALREDRQLSQGALAALAGVPVPQLSRIEKGGGDARPATVRTLLRALNATFADIAGPDAPEVSVKTIITRVVQAGVPRELAAALAAAVPRRATADLLARAFGWAKDSLVHDVPQVPPLPVPVQFKAASGQQPTGSPLVHLALSIARDAQSAFAVHPYRPFPADPAAIRREARDVAGRVTLASLLEWAWGRGVAVLPLSGKGGFSAAVLAVGDAPTIIIKEGREFAVFWLFDLAHEIGHIALGHVGRALIDVQSPTNPTTSDADELSATTFALELLLPNHEALLEEVRADARGDGVRFKFAVERVADRAGVSRGLLGIVAAFALQEVGRSLDRWGSATNLARPEGTGRDQLQRMARRYATLDRIDPVGAALLGAVVFDDEP